MGQSYYLRVLGLFFPFFPFITKLLTILFRKLIRYQMSIISRRTNRTITSGIQILFQNCKQRYYNMLYGRIISTQCTLVKTYCFYLKMIFRFLRAAKKRKKRKRYCFYFQYEEQISRRIVKRNIIVGQI